MTVKTSGTGTRSPWNGSLRDWTVVSREGRVDRRELKGMGDSTGWCEGNMEISVNEILTLELLCMSSFKNDKFQRSWWIEVVVTEKHSVLVSFRCAKLGSMRTDGRDPRSALHERRPLAEIPQDRSHSVCCFIDFCINAINVRGQEGHVD